MKRYFLIMFMVMACFSGKSFADEHYNFQTIINQIKSDSLFLEYRKLYSDNISGFKIKDTVVQDITFLIFFEDMADCFGIDSSGYNDFYMKINTWTEEYLATDTAAKNKVFIPDAQKYNDLNSPIILSYSIILFESYTIVTVFLEYDPFKYYQKNDKNCNTSLIFNFIYQSKDDYCYYSYIVN